MFSLYLHIPYCTAICPYCDFNVFATRSRPERRYTEALLAEMRHAAGEEAWRGRQVQTIYFGGGTPSLFEPASIDRLIRGVRDHWPLARDAEVTLEATPESADAARLAGYRQAGVNRLSLGLQSMHAHTLRRLGRVHGVEDNQRAFAAARQARLDNVSVDLIFAVPGQSRDEWEADLAAVVALSPEHVSAYNLTYEERTRFFVWRARGDIVPAPEEDEEVMFSRTREVLSRAGYEAYEISNFARPGHRSRHNRNYWNGTSYLGLGAGAHSYLADGWGHRWSNERNHLRYMKAAEESGTARLPREALSRDQAMGEYVFLCLRQAEGLAMRSFESRFGVPFDVLFPRLAELRDEGLLEPTEGGYRLSPRGLLLADSIFAMFF